MRKGTSLYMIVDPNPCRMSGVRLCVGFVICDYV